MVRAIVRAIAAEAQNDKGENVRTSQRAVRHSLVRRAAGHTDDQSARFLEEGIWGISSPSQKEQALVRSMRPGERIAIKAAYVAQSTVCRSTTVSRRCLSHGHQGHRRHHREPTGR